MNLKRLPMSLINFPNGTPWNLLAKLPIWILTIGTWFPDGFLFAKPIISSAQGRPYLVGLGGEDWGIGDEHILQLSTKNTCFKVFLFLLVISPPFHHIIKWWCSCLLSFLVAFSGNH